MDKALKVLIVLLLLLSIAALSFEVVLFLQRGELKGRNQALVNGVINVAGKIEMPPDANVDLATRDLPRVQLKAEEFKHYFQIGPDGKIMKDAAGNKLTTGPGTLETLLSDTLGKADLQLTRLNDTRVALEQTRGILAQTSNTLVKTEQELAQTKDTLKKTEADLAAARQDIEQKKGQIAELTAKNETLTADVEKKTAEIAKLTDKVGALQSEADAHKRRIKDLEKELVVVKGVMSGGTNALPPGLRGQVLFINTNWNFVVMDLIPEARVFPLTDLTIQREDKLVGKVRVSEVIEDRNFAFGEILSDWAKIPVAKGDYVFY